MRHINLYFTILLAAGILSGCMQDTVSTESTPTKPASKKAVLQTTIQGLDLSKPQDSEYFRSRYDQSQEFVAWCDKTMVEQIPKDETSQMFYKNCKEAGFAIMLGRGNLEKRHKHESY